jgi:hypothetical protein
MNESNISARNHNPQEDRLDSLLHSYRVACEPREVSPNFMPELWQRIEKAQSATFSFRRIAKGFVAAAAMLSLVLAIVSFLPSSHNVPIYSSAWVDTLAAHHEALAAHNSGESIEYVLDLIHPDLTDEASEI